MITRILVPVDGSRFARHAVEAAGDIATKYGAPVFLLHVIRDLSLPKEILDMITAGEVTASRQEILEDSARIILEDAAELLDGASIPSVTCDHLFGDPATKIVEYAGRNGVDLIVMGHRGLAPGGELLGSISRKVLSLTEIACLIIT